MRQKILRRLKPGYVNKKKIYGFDVETWQEPYKGHIRQHFLMGSVVGQDLVKVFWNQQDMADFMIKSRNLRDNLVFATNLEFDFEHVFQKTEYNEHFRRIDKHGLIYARYNKGKIHKIEFLDTDNFLNKVSVAKLGKLVNLRKLDSPKCFLRKPENEEEKQELIRYNLRDSWITQRTGVMLQDFFNILGCKMKITIASSGMDNWRRYGQPYNLFQEPKDIILKHFEGSIHGGRTEVFKRGYIKNIHYYDFNSHYPACCVNGVDGEGSYPDPNSVKRLNVLDKEYVENYEGITKAKIRAPESYIPMLGITFDGKFIFPSGEFTGWFTNIELRYAMEKGYEVLKIYDGIYYVESFVPFKDLLTKLYNMRLQYKKEKNSAMEQMVKLMMNGGSFGKFAQKPFDITEMFHEKNIDIDDNGGLYVIERGKPRKLNNPLLRGEYIYNKVSNPRLPLFLFPILASYTTALARIKLYEYMNRYPKDLVYCDTDSLVMKRSCFESSKKLGELKKEYSAKEAIFVKPKMYYIDPINNSPIFRIKGVGKSVNCLEDFFNILKGNPVTTKTFTKIKSSAVRKLPFSTIIDVEKSLGLEDDKRLWERKFKYDIEQDSCPIMMKGI